MQVDLRDASAVTTHYSSMLAETFLLTQDRGAGVADRVIFDGGSAYEAVLSRSVSVDLGISLLDPADEQWRTALDASNKRYQYMQAGLPQIGDMNPRISELLEGQGIGRCVEAFSEEAVAAIVWDYAGDPERCRREGDRAYALHLERYNYQADFRPVLDWIADRDRPGKADAFDARSIA